MGHDCLHEKSSGAGLDGCDFIIKNCSHCCSNCGAEAHKAWHMKAIQGRCDCSNLQGLPTIGAGNHGRGKVQRNGLPVSQEQHDTGVLAPIKERRITIPHKRLLRAAMEVMNDSLDCHDLVNSFDARVVHEVGRYHLYYDMYARVAQIRQQPQYGLE